MLQSAAVYPSTLDILKKIMDETTFDQFNLVGGTALALQIGHRISIDLDLFTHEEYSAEAILEGLHQIGKVDIIIDKPPFLQVNIDNLKLDFLKFPYNFVRHHQIIEGVRLVSIEHIAIMKLLAIARRGAKKDFFDLYFILQQYTLKEVISFFEKTLSHIDLFHILKSLTYFDDAENDADPIMIKSATWKAVKTVITTKVNHYLQN